MAFLVNFSLGGSDVGGAAVVVVSLMLVTLIVEANVQRPTLHAERRIQKMWHIVTHRLLRVISA